MIELKNVSFSYGKMDNRQLKNVDFSINKGDFILFCGRSACGKTTLTKSINGLIPHFIKGQYTGDVLLNGNSVKNMPIYKISEKIGSVFQNPKTQFFNLDSDSELAFGMENMGLSPNKITTRLKEVIHTLQIENLLNRRVLDLSGGEKQTLAIASIYAVNPDVYVLDEPTANIDSDGIDLLHDILKKLKKMGKTIIISEHRLYFLMDLIDKAIYIENGVIQKVYSKKEFLSINETKRKKLGLRCFNLQQTCSKIESSIKKSDDLQVENLTIAYGKNILIKNGSFSAKKGDIIAVTGENGCGKSALMRVLCGLRKESCGKISYLNKIYPYKKRRELCYMTMQDVVHQLFSDSVLEEFSLLNKENNAEAITNILKKLDLLQFKDKHPMTLSGGQKQRLALAVATLSQKEIMIFDEPTSGLDYGNMCNVSEIIKQLSKNKIVFVVTHDKELLEMACNRKIEIFQNELKLFQLEKKQAID